MCAYSRESSVGGKYFVTFIDDSSRYVWCYIIKNKSDVIEKVQEFEVLVENLYDRKITFFSLR